MQQIPELAARFRIANRTLAESLIDWILTKPAARRLDRPRASELMIAILGGWLLYLSRWDEFDAFEGFSPDRLRRTWADHWGAFLDSAPRAAP